MTSGNYYSIFYFCLSCPSAVPVSSQGSPRAGAVSPWAVPRWSKGGPRAVPWPDLSQKLGHCLFMKAFQSFWLLNWFFSGCTIFLNPQKFDKFGFRIMPFFLNHVSPTLIVTLLAIRIVLKHGQSIIRVFAWKLSEHEMVNWKIIQNAKVHTH